MPTSPADWEGAALEVRRIYEEAESNLLERIARRLARGIDNESWADYRLREVRAVRAEVEREVAKASRDATRTIERSVAKAYQGGSEQAARDLLKILERPIQDIGRQTFVATHRRAVEALAAETVAKVQSTHFQILRSADDIYRQVIAEASGQAMAGAMTRREAAQVSLNRFADQGVARYVDRAGRNWDIASYSEMATRSAAGRAAVQGHVDRLQENGYDLVIVSVSPDPCEMCDEWEGRVLSMGGEHAGDYPTLAEAQADGLFHPNCTHSVSAYIPGLTERPERRPKKERSEGYQIRQRQRYNERQIRKWKRREVVAITDEDKMLAKRKVREWQAEQRKHLEQYGREFKRDYARESISRAR